jgi:peptidoglycan hydrolase-like protein with peptidoglycan-binding domain
MQRRKMGLVLFLVIFVSLLAGCATTARQKDNAQSLRNQVIALESELQQKDAEIDSLRRALSSTTEEKYAATKEKQQGTISKPTMKQIQTALKNAGFDPGSVDGKMGKSTRNAIKEFQKANNLNADGKVGPKTWSVLGQHLNKAGQ